SSSMYSAMFLPPLFAAPFTYYPPLYPILPEIVDSDVIPPLLSDPGTAAIQATPAQQYYWGHVYDPKFYYILGQEPKKPKRRRKFKNKLMQKLFEKKEKKEDGFIFIPMGNSMIFIRE